MATPVIAFNQLANDIESDGMNPNHAERVAVMGLRLGVGVDGRGIGKLTVFDHS